MKKFLSILLTIALLLTLSATLGGCKNRQPTAPLRVILDDGGSFPDEYLNAYIEEVRTFIVNKGGPTEIEFERLPLAPDERNIVLTRIKTEIMAGEGPDVFIMNVGSNSFWYEKLFRLPDKNMRNLLLLPLDKYMKKAQFMEADQMTEVIMEAGQTKDGQVLIPLSYTFPVTFFRKAEVQHEPSADLTWQDMLDDPTGIMQRAAALPVINYSGEMRLSAVIGALADYNTNRLNFTEDELRELLYQILENDQRAVDGAFDGKPDRLNTEMMVNFESRNKFGDGSLPQDAYTPNTLPPALKGLKKNVVDGGVGLVSVASEDLTMIPLYNRTGGVTATVTSFAAINANTRRPEEAFFVLDLLCSKEAQQLQMVQNLYLDNGIPVYDGQMTEDDPVPAINGAAWYMTENNYAEFCKVRDVITAVNIGNVLESELENLMLDSFWIMTDEKEGDIEKEIIDRYRTMRQTIGE